MGGFPAGVRLVGGAWLLEDVRDAAHGPAVSVGAVFGLHELGEPDHEPASRFASARALPSRWPAFPSQLGWFMPAARFASTARFALMAADSCGGVAAQIAASCRPVAAAITNDFRRDRAAMLAMDGALELQATSVDRSVLDALDYVRLTASASMRWRAFRAKARHPHPRPRGGPNCSQAGSGRSSSDVTPVAARSPRIRWTVAGTSGARCSSRRP